LSQEGQLLDKKSLRAVWGKTANWSELAKDCIAFSNALGGTLLIGIEDGQANPPADQTIPPDLSDTIRRKLAALVLEDLQRYPKSAISDIHQRIGGEIHPKQVKRTLEELTAKGSVRLEGDKRWRRYWAVPS
jgi:predicted HTH transcriptional regulator